MSATGYLQVHAFTGKSRIPLKDVAVTVVDPEGTNTSMRLTNRSGLLNSPLEVAVPALSAGQSPDTGVLPFTRLNLYARIKNYESIEVENIQIFPDVLTIQDLEMIPLSELPDSWNKLEIFHTPPQKL